MNRTQYLQNLIERLQKPEHYEFTVEYRGRAGWWMNPDENRDFQIEQGDFLGRNWQQAEERIKLLMS